MDEKTEAESDICVYCRGEFGVLMRFGEGYIPITKVAEELRRKDIESRERGIIKREKIFGRVREERGGGLDGVLDIYFLEDELWASVNRREGGGYFASIDFYVDDKDRAKRALDEVWGDLGISHQRPSDITRENIEKKAAVDLEAMYNEFRYVSRTYNIPFSIAVKKFEYLRYISNNEDLNRRQTLELMNFVFGGKVN